MKHELKISIRRAPFEGSVVKNQTVTLRERLLKRMFGEKHRVMVIVPGDSVERVSISELPEEGNEDERA
ncbi:MAG: hypothetical protein GX434_15220 [Peptococcaceae bacterium]|nr:hypothetical protein [Peptococcaceae bacterium]